MPGTKKRENCMEKLLNYYFTSTSTFCLAVRAEACGQISKTVPHPVSPPFIFKDFIRARDQKYREIVFVYLLIYLICIRNEN